MIEKIVQDWRLRQRWHRAEKSLMLQGKALCRAWAGGDKDEANKLFDLASSDPTKIDPALAIALEPFLTTIEHFSIRRSAIEKSLRKAVKSLPVWPWVAEIKGLSLPPSRRHCSLRLGSGPPCTGDKLRSPWRAHSWGAYLLDKSSST